MFRNITNIPAPQICRAFKLFSVFAALLLGTFNITASPQAGRPDIQWMRGGHRDQSTVSATVFSPNGEMIITSSNADCKITRASDGILLMSIPRCVSNYKPFAFSPDNQTVAVLTDPSAAVNDEVIDIWRISDKTLVRSIYVTNFASIFGINFSPDGTKIVAGSLVYNVANGSPVYSINAGSGESYQFFLFSPDSRYIYGGYTYYVSGGGGTSATRLVAVDLSSGQGSLSLIGSATSGYPVAISPNGQYLITERGGDVVRISDGVVVHSFGFSNNWLTSYAFSGDGQYVVQGRPAFGGTAMISSTRTSNWTQAWSIQAGQANENGPITLSTAGQTIAVSFKTTRLLNLADGSLIRNLTTLSYDAVYSLAFSPDGQTLATGSGLNNRNNLASNISLWNVADGSRKNVNFILTQQENINQIFFTPDNQKVLTFGTYLRLWDVNDGSLIRNYSFNGGANGIALSPDGQTIAVGNGSATAFYRLADGTTLPYSISTAGYGGVYSPNGQIYAAHGTSQGQSSLNLYNATNGSLIRSILTGAGPNGGGASRLSGNTAFSPDGSLVAFINEATNNFPRSGFVKVYRVSDGSLVRSIGQFDNWGASFVFSKDSQNVIATGWDATVRIWRISDGENLKTYTNETGFQPGSNYTLGQVVLSPDGSRFAYARADATVVMASNPYNQSNTPRTNFDFDGDGKADVSVFRPSTGAWYLQQSQAGFTGVSFGVSTDKIVPADYDGDGKTDVAVYRSGTWYLQRSSQGFTGISFGTADDIPVPADYDGDGKADVAVFRNGAWYILGSQVGFYGISFGQTGDRPVPADYDGDGKADVAVFRNGTWYINRSQQGFTGIAFGDSNDKIVPADYDGDGKADVSVFRPSTGAWYLQRSQLGFTGIGFGISTDLPSPADFDGDGKADVAVFRNGTWYLQQTTAGFTGISFGASTDLAVPNAYVR